MRVARRLGSFTGALWRTCAAGVVVLALAGCVRAGAASGQRTILPLVTHRDTVPAYPRAWRWQNPLPNGNPLASVSFADDANGWTVGGHGTVFKTADGGLTWSAQDSTVPVDLTRVVGSSSTTAWAVGNAGTIVRTRDGGATWTRLESGSTENLTDLAVPTEGVVWVVGENGTILRTDDSGATCRRPGSPAPGTS
jgi:hypothetical protein